MADSGVAVDYPVYLGIWTNWSLGGRVTGSTITMTHRNGTLLTVFLALFVTFAGSRTWRIACFALCQLFLAKSDEAQDGLYHQRQAILRNATSGASGSIRLLRTLWAWRSRADRPLSRMLPIIVFSITMTVVLAAASLFSSRINSTMGKEVLISSPHCGLPLYTVGVSPLPSPTKQQGHDILNPWNAEKITSYANYVQRCYSDRSTPDACAPFVQKRLPTHVDQNASCPFHMSICRHENENIRLDSGYLNSQTHLGINGPSDFQFNLRIVTHCAPLTTKNYEKTVNYSQDKPYIRYFLGPRTMEGLKLYQRDYTYEIGQQSPDELKWENRTSSLADYGIDSEVYRIYNGSTFPHASSFISIPELTLGDGDTTVVFLSANGVMYTVPVDDDLYAAHRRANDSLIGGFSNANAVDASPYYLADEPASSVGCKMSYQICDPALPPEKGCTSPGGAYDINFGIETPQTRRDRIIRWVMAASGIDVNLAITTLKESSLTSRFRLISQFQGSLLANQWQMEVENWHNIVLATYQGLIVDAATGPGDPEMLEHFWTPPNNTEEKYLCQNQKIISTAYTNISTLWLIFVLLLGAIIILLEFFLETIVVFLQSRGFIKFSSVEWFSNDVLQLQRMAHEELGLGNTWSGCTGPHVIPVTEKGQLLAVLDVSDPTHPRLVNPLELSKPERDSKSSKDVCTTEETEIREQKSPDSLDSLWDSSDTGKTLPSTDSRGS